MESRRGATLLACLFIAPPGVGSFSVQMDSSLRMDWLPPAAAAVSITLTYAGDSHTWFGISINSQATMVGGNAITFEPASSRLREWALGGTSMGSISQLPSTALGSIVNVTRNPDGGLSVAFTRNLAGPSGGQAIQSSGDTTIVWAHGSSGEASMTTHTRTNCGSYAVNFAAGTSRQLNVSLDFVIVAHGLCMFLAWAVLIPCGACCARYNKKVDPTTGPDAYWFVYHWRIQLVGLLFAAVGLIIGITKVAAGAQLTLPHHKLGVAAVALGLAQPLLANRWVRPAKVPGSKQRTLWTLVHRGVAYVALVLAAAAIITGLQVALLPAALVYVYVAVLAGSVLLVAYREHSSGIWHVDAFTGAPVPGATTISDSDADAPAPADATPRNDFLPVREVSRSNSKLRTPSQAAAARASHGHRV